MSMSSESKLKDASALSGKDLAFNKALAAAMDANDAKLPKFEDVDDGTTHVHVNHVGTYSEMFGSTKSMEFAGALLEACGNVSGRNEALGKDKTHALAIVAEIAPQDGIEAMLATQMAAVHITAMRESRLMAGAQTSPQLDAHEKALNKLMRTFTAQMEALRKHRHGGKQTVTVQHVNVEDGGQAIVGNVETRGRGRLEK